MKFAKFTHLLVLALTLTFAAAGCRHRPENVTPLPGQKGGTTGPTDDQSGKLAGDNTGGGVKSDTGIPANDPTSHQGWPEDRAALQAYTVHFDFDSSVVKAGEKSKVAAVAEFLKKNAEDAVKIEGYCDERGTEEYNRSLGERRASALREDLVSQGIAATRIDTLSFGKDRPADPGHNEEAWRKNRRGEFILLVHPK
jgi:peptidoglycan-associated lipoprotein